MSAVASVAAEARAGDVFSGYASLFNVADLSGDVLLPGAFRASLARRGAAGVKMLYQHDPARPIGRWLQIAEDSRGLRVTGLLHTEVAAAREVRSLVDAGILDGLSIGFRTVRARSDAAAGIRRVAEVDLWEVSVVTFPMLPAARIDRLGGDGADLARRMAELSRRLVAARR
ncbi:HK97 family phage prohead protease [Pleomorphomonas koreensis]|uniref:HK97 family phage prohead protease n=1 Tax=Pleomorphomonas koreensis TaxID=257440 RepID=UPI000416BEE4|nr:HK97 family phage prohead protease [Pleomorphomonas koreensis]